MNPLWPEKHSLMDTMKAVPRIKEALDSIAADTSRVENASVWPRLQAIEPARSRIELFRHGLVDFRQVEPVVPAQPA